jgi:transposase
MKYNHTYFPRSTAQQRKLLFERWEATGSVTQASQAAHLSRTTFYLWYPRFVEQGYAGLLEAHKTVRKHQQTIAPAIAEQVLQMRREHAEWGKQRIADELTKQHNWVAVVSPNTVQRILQEAGLWETGGAQKKTKTPPR